MLLAACPAAFLATLSALALSPFLPSIAQDLHTSVALLGQIPLGRLGRPEDVAEAALFLAADAAAFISGIAVPIDGATLAGAAGNLEARRRTRPGKQGGQ